MIKMVMGESSVSNKINYKFNEDALLKDFAKYIDSTYSGHYARNQFQATEFVIDGGHGTGFCIGNVMKYAQRYGKKGNPDDWRKDIMKVLHYALIQLYVHDTTNSTQSIDALFDDYEKQALAYLEFEKEFKK